MPRSPLPPAPQRRGSPKSSATRRRDNRQPTLPFRPPPRTGATKIRPSDASGPLGRRLARLLVALAAAILLANAFIGERGLVKTSRVRRAHQQLADDIQRLREENQRLAREAERLRHDRSAIEELARGELGLIMPGEQLFIIAEPRLSHP
jgi:cell division protein FtsB